MDFQSYRGGGDMVPPGLTSFDGEVPEGVDVLLAFGGDGTVLEADMVRNGSAHSRCEHGRLGF